MERSDEELVLEYRKGDETAFAILVDRYTPRIYAFAHRLSADMALSEDATQETFVKAWKSLGKFDARQSFKSWIFSIASNATIDLLRKRKDTVFSNMMKREDDDTDFEENIVDEALSSDEKFDEKLLQKTIEEVIESLTFDQKTAVLLHDKEGLTFDEISTATGKSANTIKSHYRRALIKLRELLGKRPT